jgi:hypothetical protein
VNMKDIGERLEHLLRQARHAREQAEHSSDVERRINGLPEMALLEREIYELQVECEREYYFGHNGVYSAKESEMRVS